MELQEINKHTILHVKDSPFGLRIKTNIGVYQIKDLSEDGTRNYTDITPITQKEYEEGLDNDKDKSKSKNK